MANAITVIAGGSGTQADVAAVAGEAARLPPEVAKLFKKKKIKIVACRGSVTDFETSLRNVVPRGWEGLGRTWDSVPGTYLDGRRRVVIATVAGPGGRTVPSRATGSHGSANLVLHEAMHGYDYAGRHQALRDARFVAARMGDFAKLGSYERQDGRAGLEESYAESASRFYGGDATMPADWPNLHAFWQVAFAGDEAPPAPLPRLVRGGPVGMFRIEPDQAIILDLRAEGPGGAIGHAALSFRAGEPEHERLIQHFAARGEAALGGDNLFYPLPRPRRRRTSD